MKWLNIIVECTCFEMQACEEDKKKRTTINYRKWNLSRLIFLHMKKKPIWSIFARDDLNEKSRLSIIQGMLDWQSSLTYITVINNVWLTKQREKWVIRIGRIPLWLMNCCRKKISLYILFAISRDICLFILE